jgi:hypothetical protein
MILWKRNGPITECTGTKRAEIILCDKLEPGIPEVICLNRRKHGESKDDLCQCISEKLNDNNVN